MSKWQEILDKAKARQAELRPKANVIDAELNRLALEIFEAETALKKEEEERGKGLKSWAKVDCFSHPNNPPINSED